VFGHEPRERKVFVAPRHPAHQRFGRFDLNAAAAQPGLRRSQLALSLAHRMPGGLDFADRPAPTLARTFRDQQRRLRALRLGSGGEQAHPRHRQFVLRAGVLERPRALPTAIANPGE
jgi:hypothetical protein